jgi:hypothetical protein
MGAWSMSAVGDVRCGVDNNHTKAENCAAEKQYEYNMAVHALATGSRLLVMSRNRWGAGIMSLLVELSGLEQE